MSTIALLGLIVLAAPALLLAGIGSWSLTGRRLSERAMSQAVQAAVWTGLVAAVAVLALMLVHGDRHVVVSFGDRVSVPHYHFSAQFVFDRLSVPFVILTYLLGGAIGAFGTRYMHREDGFNRFYVLYALFLLGMVVTSLAGTIEVLFAGWEMVGLSSALLVAFFHERPAPARNGLRVWTVYRISDAALLAAALLLHRMAGQGNFDQLMTSGPWPFGEAAITEAQAFTVGLLLLVAAAGKSALIPFSGWLPRAMEGPTPSSAVFYGALSVHLGAFLLLRVNPLLVHSSWLCAMITVVGLATAALATLAARVQSDVKSALSFASLTQVGIIVAEIGLLPPLFGPEAAYIPLVHILGHASLRTLQFVRAPSLLQDYRLLENALGERLPRAIPLRRRLLSESFRLWLYRFALERGYLDAFLNEYVVKPFLKLFGALDRLERRWIAFLAGDLARESDPVPPSTGLLDDLGSA